MTKRLIASYLVLTLIVIGAFAAPNTNSDSMHQEAASQPVNWMSQLSPNDIVKTAVIVEGGNATVIQYLDLNTPHFDVYDTTTGALRGRIPVPNCTGIRFLTALATPQLLFVSCGQIALTYHTVSLTVIATVYPPPKYSFANVYPIGRGLTDMLWIDQATDSLASYDSSIGLDMATGTIQWRANFSHAKVGAFHVVDCAAVKWCAVYAPDLGSNVLSVSAVNGQIQAKYKVTTASSPPFSIAAGSTDTACISNCLVVFWSQQILPIVLQLSQADNTWGFDQLSTLDVIPNKIIRFVAAFRPARTGIVQPWYVGVAYATGNVTWHPAATGSIAASWATPGFRGFNLVDAAPSADTPKWMFVLSTHDETRLQQSQTGAGFLLTQSNTTWTLNPAAPVWTTTLDNVYVPSTGVYPCQVSADGTQTLVAFPGTIIVGAADIFHRYISLIDVGSGNIHTNLIFPPTPDFVRTADLPLYDATHQSYIAWTSLPNGIASFSAASRVRSANTAGTGTMSAMSWNGKLTSMMSDGTVSSVSIVPNSHSLLVSPTTAQLPGGFIVTDSGPFMLPDGAHECTYFTGYNNSHGCFGVIGNDPKVLSILCDANIMYLKGTLNGQRTHLLAYGDGGARVMLTMTGASVEELYIVTGVLHAAIVDNDNYYVATDNIVTAYTLSQHNNALWSVAGGAYGLTFGLSNGLTRTVAFCSKTGGFFEVNRNTGVATTSVPSITCASLIATYQSVYYVVAVDITVNQTIAYFVGIGYGAKFLTSHVGLPTAVSDMAVLRQSTFTVTNDRVGLLVTPTQIYAFDFVNGQMLWSSQFPIATIVKSTSLSPDMMSLVALTGFSSTAGIFAAITAFNTITGDHLMQVQTLMTNTMAVVGFPVVGSPCVTMFADDGFSNGILLYECIPTDLPVRPNNWNPNAPQPTYTLPPTPVPSTLAPVDPDDGSNAKTAVAIVVSVLVVGGLAVGGFVFYRKRNGRSGSILSRGAVDGYSSVESAVDMKSLRASSVA